MSDPISLLLDGYEEADDAETDGMTASEEDGSTEALLDALNADDSPESDADSSETESTDEIDYKAELETLRAEWDRERQEYQTAANKRQQDDQLRMMQEAQRAWQQEEQGVIQQASQMENCDQASAHLIRYYQSKIAQQAEAARMLIAEAYSGQYVQQVATDSGLTNEDVELLRAVDAKHVPGLAKALAAKNQHISTQLSDLQNQVKQLQRGRQSNRRALTGADRSSSAHGTAPQRKIVDGSNDHALLLMQATQALRTRR